MSATAPPFADSRQHLAAELAWLDRALLALVNTTAPAGPGWAAEGDGEPFDSPESVRQARQDLVARVEAGHEHGSPLVLPRLSALFGLTPEEELLLVACAAPEIDPRYGELYGHLHGDATRWRPSARLVTAVAGFDRRCPVDGGALLDPQAAAFRWRLAGPADNGAAHRPGHGIALDPGILALITGHRWEDGRIDAALRPLPAADPAAWPYGDAVDRLAVLLADDTGRIVAHFHGPLASEGRRVALAACRRLGVGLLHADAGELLALSQSGELPLADGLRLLYRQAALGGAGVYLSGLDALLDDPRAAAHLRTLEGLLPDASWFTCTEAERLWLPGPSLPTHITFLPFEPPALDHRQRRTVWERAMPGLPAEQMVALATHFPSTPGEVADAVRLARGRARAAGGDEPAYEDLLWACRAPSRAALDGLARPLTPRTGWDDLILPADVLEQLRELCAQVRHRGLVLDEWALGRRTALGHGVQALFLGPSGTGKTLAAEVVAAAVGMGLVKVDLSTVVSKYIGETEKHLARVFTAAERSGSILLFDEADALFGKRSEVGDAHDRYANIEVSYLLQRIEEYAGVVILATNFAQNIDEAFQRRLRVSISFPFPDEAARLAIWRRHLPGELPVTADLDLTRMARQFKVPGGVIRKIVWNAAFLAADDGGRMDAGHLLLATRREYERMGKPFPASGVAR
ncbi:AAA family ATPase [Streptosporangium sp. NPDC002607]